MKYQVTKTYGHNLGLSACFRQHRADSHCKFLHGYALSFKLVFEATTLNAKNWVVGFGDLKPVKKYLEDTFDHKTTVAGDDPHYATFLALHEKGLIQMMTVPAIGCESFARMVYNKVASILLETCPTNDVILVSVECREHEGNSAIYIGDDNADHKNNCYRASCPRDTDAAGPNSNETGVGGNTPSGR